MLKTYAYHRPTAATLKTITELREMFSALHAKIEELVPLSRERSVALTNLETSAMWAIKAAVSNDPESEVDLPDKRSTDIDLNAPRG